MTENSTRGTLALALGLVALAIFALGGCAHSPTAPAPATPAPVISTVGYDINIPDVHVVEVLKASYPDGVRLAPLDAQRQWDYTAAYHGSPNVYFGETSPWVGHDCAGNLIPGLQQYMGVGIVVAPHAVAGMAQFTALDWPGIGLEAGVTYAWVGRFVYTISATLTNAPCS